MNVDGHPIEILSLDKAHCADEGPNNGKPLCLFTFRPENCMAMPETLTGLIERVTYHNPENGFAVLKVVVKGRLRTW
jgi:hypothetical protein